MTRAKSSMHIRVGKVIPTRDELAMDSKSIEYLVASRPVSEC